MKLIGFGCSFTYGSELLDPNVAWDGHHENTRYREKHVWLGQLAERLNCNYLNLAEPGCSNYAIQEIFADWFSNNIDNNILVCVAWTHNQRHSWWYDNENRWVHDGFIRYNSEKVFTNSFKEWLTLSHKRCKKETQNAKLFVNSVCLANNIKIIQFDALDYVNDKNNYSNYHQRGLSMKQCLEGEEKSLEKTFLTDGNHPNEAGHAYYAKLLHIWITARGIITNV